MLACGGTEVRTPRQRAPGSMPHSAENIQGGNGLIFVVLIIYVCFSTMSQMRNRALGTELKIMPEHKQLPPRGLALTCLGCTRFVGLTRKQSATVWGSPLRLSPKPSRAGVALLVFTPFRSSVSHFVSVFN